MSEQTRPAVAWPEEPARPVDYDTDEYADVRQLDDERREYFRSWEADFAVLAAMERRRYRTWTVVAFVVPAVVFFFDLSWPLRIAIYVVGVLVFRFEVGFFRSRRFTDVETQHQEAITQLVSDHHRDRDVLITWADQSLALHRGIREQERRIAEMDAQRVEDDRRRAQEHAERVAQLAQQHAERVAQYREEYRNYTPERLANMDEIWGERLASQRNNNSVLVEMTQAEWIRDVRPGGDEWYTAYMSEHHPNGPPLPEGRYWTKARVFELTGTEFEQVVADRLRRDGLSDAQVSGQAGDRGADVIGHTEGGDRYVIQCKRYRDQRITSAQMQQFCGMVWGQHNADYPIYITTSAFTKEALAIGRERGVYLMQWDNVERWLNTDSSILSNCIEPST